uniref:Ubiquitin-like domain-containing protein n=1 Tax=Sander lucioperca TaxID=283035 RepID=A0A8C9WYD4_SANLU
MSLLLLEAVYIYIYIYHLIMTEINHSSLFVSKEKIQDFKRKVQNREGVAESQQHLIHEGKEMNAGRLSDYNVRAGSLIILTLHLRGGHGLN